MKRILFTGIYIFLLTACGEKTYTVNDFNNDQTLRNKYVLDCRNGKLDIESLNCRNAIHSDMVIKNEESVSKFKSLAD